MTKNTDSTTYLPRSSYRSVAFRTWKYGEASTLFSKRNGEKVAPSECKPAENFRFTKSLNSKATGKVAGHEGVEAVLKANTVTSTAEIAPIAKLNRNSRSFSLENLSEGGQDAGESQSAFPSSHLHASQQSGGSLGSVALHLVNMNNRHKFNSSQTADCYSSTEYVKYCSQNVYENVIVDSRLCPLQSPLNRSIDALNERIRERLPTTSTAKRPENISAAQPSTTTTSLAAQPPAPYFVIDPCCSSTTLGRSAAESLKMRARTKSLDNNTKLSVNPRLRVVDERLELSKAEEQAMTTSPSVATSTLMSAKNFLRRLYNSSTQKFRNNNAADIVSAGGRKKTEQKVSNNEKFQFATSPFFEIRLPELEERPFLPYNIHYQVDDDEPGESFVPATPLLCSSPKLQSKQFTDNYTNSPDEGVYCSSSASSSANSSILNTRTHQEDKISSRANNAQIAPVVPPNFEDFLNLSTPTVISPVHGHQSVNIPSTPPQPSLGHVTTSSHAFNGIQKAFEDSKSTNTSFASVFNTLPHNNFHQSMTTVSEPIKPFHLKEQEKKFSNWNELFRYLRQEIREIRASDANILSNLRAIENELISVKDSRENSKGRFN